MTQIYKIDTNTLMSEQMVEDIVNEWANVGVNFRIKEHFDDSWGEQETRDFMAFGPRTQQHLHVAVYRKDDINYIWRGMLVDTKVRERIKKAIYSDATGTVLLYKTGGHRRNKGCYFPLRLSNNRYAFVLGSAQPIAQWINDPSIRRPEGLDSVFDLWASEHLKDYKYLERNLRYIGNDEHRASFKQRAYYVFAMSEFISDDKWYELYELLYGDDPHVAHRSAYCVWKDGEIERWLQGGLDIHPNI